MEKRRRKLLVILILTVLLALEAARSNLCLAVDSYQVKTDRVDAPVRIVQLSDLHNARFGKDNGRLLGLVAEQQPDLILFTGDLVTGSVEQTETAAALLEGLTEIAPVYVSIGNHEQIHQWQFGSDLTELFEGCGAKVLEFTYEDIQINGQKLRLGGISGYCMPEKYLASGEAKRRECDFLHEMAGTDACRVLMCHMPYSWLVQGSLDSWEMDLVFSGHVHNGQWVVPVLGPVVAPDMGYFPGRLEGLFSSDDGNSHLLVTRGLGNSVPIPRLNNVPQILVLDILPK